MAVYKVQYQMVDTFEVTIDVANTAEEAKAIVKAELEAGNTFLDDREFISWDTGVVRVVEKLSKK